MPYNPNYNYPYSPTMFAQQNNGNYYYFVNGVEGAKSFQMQANQTVMLMDSDHPVCYMKTTNSIGQPTLRYFKLEEVDENTVRTLSTPVFNTVEYATKEDLAKLTEAISKLNERLEPKEK